MFSKHCLCGMSGNVAMKCIRGLYTSNNGNKARSWNNFEGTPELESLKEIRAVLHTHPQVVTLSHFKKLVQLEQE